MDLSAYYEQICKHSLLTREEEYDLFMELSDPGLSEREREKIRTKIINANLRFVFKQAKKFSKNEPDTFKELIGAGNEGLLVGLYKYNPNNGVRFLSYAGWWVQQRMLKEMSKMRIVALPIWKQQLIARIQKFIDSHEEGTCTFEQLKKEFPDIPIKDLKELHQTKYLTYYIDDMKDNPSFEIDPIATEVEVRLDRERIHAIIDTLPEPHKEIIHLYYGMLDGEETSHANIAKKLNISKDQLREYKKEALEMLKDKMGNAQ